MSQAELIAAIEQAIADFGGTVGVFAQNLTTGEEVAYDPDTIRPTASTIKVPILVELFNQVEQGKVSLDDRLTTNEQNATKGSGILRDLRLGVELPVEDIATLMIVVSDNQATNMMIDLLGMENINATMAAKGFPNTKLVNRIDFPVIGDDPKNLAVTTPRELAGIMAGVATNNILSEASCAGILGIMRKQHYLDTVARYFPYTPFAAELGRPDNGLRVYNKTGSWSGMRGDTALIEWPGTRYTIGLISEGATDARFWAENHGNVVLSKVSKLIFDHFGGNKLAPIPPVGS
jgi:beta-lactamase class A